MIPADFGKEAGYTLNWTSARNKYIQAWGKHVNSTPENLSWDLNPEALRCEAYMLSATLPVAKLNNSTVDQEELLLKLTRVCVCVWVSASL